MPTCASSTPRSSPFRSPPGRLEAIERSDSFGIGVRVLADGAWGFASSREVTRDRAIALAKQATAIARASATRRRSAPIVLSDLSPSRRRVGRRRVGIDPFSVPLEDKLALLLAADELLRAEPAVTHHQGALRCLAHPQVVRLHRGRLHRAVLRRDRRRHRGLRGQGRRGRRAVLSPGRGRRVGSGRLGDVTGLDLVGNAPRVAEQAAALLTAAECPSDRRDLIIESAARSRCRCTSRSATPPSSTASSARRPRSRAPRGWARATSARCATARDIVNVTADATSPASLGTLRLGRRGRAGAARLPRPRRDARRLPQPAERPRP